ncbi:hypothetical protein [Streptomyces aidingensis]|uniref:Uncharacterized protein n=1 Tax=Streptomyces aidingensis TaxID=910347 RepID=A0A1I1FA06_9ACTN|nr:hypothetical protein [Streptomyces aidingensis]SFB96177.1 hypothetical protein SAMN05421773_101656 [Streptomyces aidingensis]
MTLLTLARPEQAAGFAAFLGRQLRWDRAAAVRLRGADGVLAAFTRPARFDVLAVLPLPLAGTGTGADPVPAPAEELDITVSAGELLEAVDEESGTVTVPGAVTGPPWAGLLPPRGGWRRLAELPGGQVRDAAASVVAEFRSRTEALLPQQRTRAALDGLAEEVWSRPLAATPLPLRAVHAAHALGFLRPDGPPVAVLAAGSWLRLRTPHGSTALRRTTRGPLTLTPLPG